MSLLTTWTGGLGPCATILPVDFEGVGEALGAAPASAAYPTANLAMFFPFRLFVPYTARKMFTINGTTNAGTHHVDVGIYSQDGTRLVSIGTTVWTGTSVAQVYDITDTYLHPGLYYLAIATDTNADHFFRHSLSADKPKVAGMLQMASAFVLPAVATFALTSNTYYPVFGVTDETVV